MKILVLCHGNINRSPLAAAVLRTLGHDVKSAGFVNPGKRASGKMRRAALAHSYDLEEHRSQLCTPELVQWAELVVLMDGGNEKRFRQQFTAPVVRLGHWGDPRRDRVPDPAFLADGSHDFDQVVRFIISCALKLGKEKIGC